VATRIAVIALLVVLVVVVARVVAIWQRPGHPPIDLGELASSPGIVLFTSSDCVNCAAARAVAQSLGAPIREVTWELEPSVIERVGVEAVPLTAVVGSDGRVEWLGTGIPRKRTLLLAAASAGLIEHRQPGTDG
jgi:hypothetical protein